MIVYVDEAYVLVSQTKIKTLVKKKHFSRAEQPIKTLTTVNKIINFAEFRSKSIRACKYQLFSISPSVFSDSRAAD